MDVRDIVVAAGVISLWAMFVVLTVMRLDVHGDRAHPHHEDKGAEWLPRNSPWYDDLSARPGPIRRYMAAAFASLTRWTRFISFATHYRTRMRCKP
jgi:hypothetical protein